MRKRASKLTSLEILSNKYQQKAELKDKELNFRKMELGFEKKNIAEAEERHACDKFEQLFIT